MDFQIINNKGTFEIHGELTIVQANYFKDYFNALLDQCYEIVICLNSVNRIDNSALSALQFISNKAKKRSKTLFILGKENKSINRIITNAGLNSIFRNDY